MKTLLFGLLLPAVFAASSYAQQPPGPPTETIKTAATNTPEQQEIINLSNTKWGWMADKRKAAL